MSTVFIVPMVFMLTYTGFVTLAYSMDRHHRQLYPVAPRPDPALRLGVRLAAWLLLGMASWIAVLAWGVGQGVAGWFGVATFAALLLVWMLPYQPRWIVPLAKYGTSASVLLYAAGVVMVLPVS